MNEFPLSTLAAISHILTIGFAVSIIPLVPAFLLLKEKREMIRELVECCHIVLLGVALFNSLLLVINFADIIIAPEHLQTFINRATGPYWWSYCLMILLPMIGPQILWWKKARRNIWVALLMIFCTLFGNIMESFIIFITSVHRDYLPSSWTVYTPSVNEINSSMILFALLGVGIYLWRRRTKTKLT